jgi:hypothetical protein
LWTRGTKYLPDELKETKKVKILKRNLRTRREATHGKATHKEVNEIGT